MSLKHRTPSSSSLDGGLSMSHLHINAPSSSSSQRRHHSRRSSNRGGSFSSLSSLSGGSEDESGLESGATANKFAKRTSAIPRCDDFFLDNTLPQEYFKQDVLKLIYKLKIPHWGRYVTKEMAKDISVDRISGALTNAVYCVSPPKYLREVIKAQLTANIIGGIDQNTGLPVNTVATNDDETDATVNSSSANEPSRTTTAMKHSTSTTALFQQHHIKLPEKLLLRVYGPHVENLIDREVELDVLARLYRRHIGPKLLGIFQNGRLEKFLNAKALTKQEIRIPEVSVQIAKRMRELHDLIQLDPVSERSKGPSVFINMDKWNVPAREKLEQIIACKQQEDPSLSAEKLVKDVLCVESYDEFERVFNKYKTWLVSQYATDKELMASNRPAPSSSSLDSMPNEKPIKNNTPTETTKPSNEKTLSETDAYKLGTVELKKQLVFAHNDTQYGNLLRILPNNKASPLMSPQYEHRQIVVIDFEYSGANPRSFDIANHFCEWMSDYHDPQRPWAIHPDQYPTRSERLNLIQGYVEHGYTLSKSLSFDDEAIEAEVKSLEKQALLWRACTSASWAAWGLVQAVVDIKSDLKTRQDLLTKEGYKFDESKDNTASGEDETDKKSTNSSGDEVEEGEEDLFDYIAYAREKAMLFWADMLKFGIVTRDEYKGPIMEIHNDDK